MLTTEEKAVLEDGREVLSPIQGDLVVSLQYAISKHLVVYEPGRESSIRGEQFARFAKAQKDLIQAFLDELGAPDCVVTSQTFRNKCLNVASGIGSALSTGRIPVLTPLSFLSGTIEFATDVLRKAYPDPTTAPLRSKRDKPAIVVYGPPGVGKSTTVEAAMQNANLAVHDAGNYFALSRQDTTTEHTKSQFVPFTVLMLPPLKIYFERMEGRNEELPHKQGQHEMRSYAKWNGRRDWFDLVVSDPLVEPDGLIGVLEDKLNG